MERQLRMVTLGLLLHVALLASSVSGKIQVLSLDTKQVVEVGSNASLHCTLSPPLGPDGLKVHWFRSTSLTTLLMLKNGREEKEQQSGRYSGRVWLPPRGVAGDLTIVLRNITLSDADLYHCLVENISSAEYDEAVTELTVIGSGSLPNTSVSLKDDAIMVTFLTSDWFPQPEMLWDLDGVSLTPEKSDNITLQSNGLYRLESSVLLKEPIYGHLYGTVRHPVTGRSTGLYIHISEDMFPRLSSWAYAFFFILLLLIVGGVVIAFFMKKQIAQREVLERQNGDLSADVAWRTAVMTPESITFNPDTAHPEISVSTDSLTLLNQPLDPRPPPSTNRFETERCCLAMPAFASGCHYWEVEVGNGLEWAVGVASPRVQRAGEAYMFRPEALIWCISRFTERYTALDREERPLPVEGGVLEKIGIYLNLSGPRQLTLYDPRDWTPLYMFNNVGGERELLLPFFWLGRHGQAIQLKDQMGR